MAQLHTLCFLSSSTSSIPPNFSPSSSSSSSLLSPALQNLSLSSRKPNSLSLHRTFHHHHIIRCSSSSSILTVENPSSESQQQDENEVSTTRLLAQNVPWSATADDIRALFQQFGTVVEVELSMHSKTRNRGLAFVEMGSAEEVLMLLPSLKLLESLQEFEGRTLKMTWAKPKKKKTPPPMPSKPPVVYNLFVANLPFEARAKDLKELFQSGGSDVVSAEIIFHDTPRKSSGYGFVSFKTKKEADEALSTFQEKELLGRPIRVARSNRFVKLESELNPQTEEEQDSSEGSDQPEAYDM